MTQQLYLVIERRKYRWQGLRISRISRKRPMLARPSEQALVKLVIDIPDSVMDPRAVQVAILPEHIVAPVATAKSAPAA